MSRSLDELCDKLAYRFAQTQLLSTALTHRSSGYCNNERLEFLGDAILSFLIADELYQRFPDADEGRLSRIRANLVKGVTLASLARRLGLGGYLKLGAGEMKSGGSRRESILAGALEAVIGAAYLDGGLDVCRTLVHAIYNDRLKSVSLDVELKDPKTCLQECLQSQGLPLPTYAIIGVEGRDHEQKFKVECRVEGAPEAFLGEGGSRRKAEQDAARKALDLFKVNPRPGA